METFLEKLEGRIQIGMAIMPDGIALPVEFHLQGRLTYLKVHWPTVSNNPVTHVEIFTVQMTDGICLTFLGNDLTLAESNPARMTGIHTYLPAYVLVGRQFISADQTFTSVSFSTDDADAVFYDFDAFSNSLAPGSKIEELIDYQQEKVGRPIRRGERPIAVYFTGQFEICAVDTALGAFSANHRPSAGMGGPNGVAIRNEIVLRLALTSPAEIDDLVDQTMPLLRFLQIVAGRKQKLKRIRCRIQENDPANEFDLLWCLAWSRRDSVEDDDDRGPHPADLPLNGGTEPDKFTSVLSAWMSADNERLDARVRHSEVMAKGSYFDTDRLIAAANMFDILPSSCFDAPPDLPEDVAKVRDASLAEFRALPPSDLRGQAMGDLKRLGRHNLKSKVLQRAALLQKVSGGRFPHLDSVLKRAIDSRNHYVHGSEASEAKASFFREMMSFHTRTLEFVFGASEFIEAGWNYIEWAAQASTRSHPWRILAGGYRNMVRVHEDRLATMKESTHSIPTSH